jgi:uncharacterized protein YcbX
MWCWDEVLAGMRRRDKQSSWLAAWVAFLVNLGTLSTPQREEDRTKKHVAYATLFTLHFESGEHAHGGHGYFTRPSASLLPAVTWA